MSVNIAPVRPRAISQLLLPSLLLLKVEFMIEKREENELVFHLFSGGKICNGVGGKRCFIPDAFSFGMGEIGEEVAFGRLYCSSRFHLFVVCRRKSQLQLEITPRGAVFTEEDRIVVAGS